MIPEYHFVQRTKKQWLTKTQRDIAVSWRGPFGKRGKYIYGSNGISSSDGYILNNLHITGLKQGNNAMEEGEITLTHYSKCWESREACTLWENLNHIRVGTRNLYRAFFFLASSKCTGNNAISRPPFCNFQRNNWLWHTWPMDSSTGNWIHTLCTGSSHYLLVIRGISTVWRFCPFNTTFNTTRRNPGMTRYHQTTNVTCGKPQSKKASWPNFQFIRNKGRGRNRSRRKKIWAFQKTNLAHEIPHKHKNSPGFFQLAKTGGTLVWIEYWDKSKKTRVRIKESYEKIVLFTPTLSILLFYVYFI